MKNVIRRASPPNARRCAFTGYRPQKMPFGFDETDPRCIDFKKRVRATIQTLYDMGYRHFISGGALGMDMFAAEAVVELRKQHPEVILEMVSPFDDQASKCRRNTARGTTCFLNWPTSLRRPVMYIRKAPCSFGTVISSIMPTCCLPPMTASRAGQL